MASTHLVRPEEVADLLRVSRRTLERWRVQGDGPIFIKVGRRVLYRLHDIDSWLDRQVRRSTSQVEASDVAE